MFALFRALRPWIARGYQPKLSAVAEPLWAPPGAPAWPPLPASRRTAGDRAWSILAFCPTYVAPDNAGPQAETIAQVVAQLAAAQASLPALRVVLVVGMQHQDEQQDEAIARLGLLKAGADGASVQFAGFLLPERGKVKSVNVALRTAAAMGADGLLQVDDDICLEPGCLVAMCRAFIDQGGRGAVGATKLGLPRQNSASRLLHWLKDITRPACNYPHACCMLVEVERFSTGIPLRYVSDDGYICFRLLAPAAPRPFIDLTLVEDARCRHYVGGPLGPSIRRIRRMLLNHHILMADAEPAVARFYLRRILFPGLWPIGVLDLDPSKGIAVAAGRWGLRFLYFCWFTRIGLELALRGLLDRPLEQVEWAGFVERDAPRAVGGPSKTSRPMRTYRSA